MRVQLDRGALPNVAGLHVISLINSVPAARPTALDSVVRQCAKRPRTARWRLPPRPERGFGEGHRGTGTECRKDAKIPYMDLLHGNLVKLIVETCNVTDPVPKPLPVETPLFGPGSAFGLDSLDAVEVAVAIQQQYGLRITDRAVFRSLKSLAAHISDHLDAAPAKRCAC